MGSALRGRLANVLLHHVGGHDLSSQCLDRRIPDKANLVREVAAWVEARNKNNAVADWQFTTDDARIKLRHLYPAF